MKPILLKRCKNCGYLTPDENKFCNHCTQRFDKNLFEFFLSEGPFSKKRFRKEWVCPNCNHISPVKNKVCNSCFYKMEMAFFS